MKKTLVSMALAGTVMLASAAAQALPLQVFSTDFESGVPVEFSSSATSMVGIGAEAVNQGLSTYHGRFTRTDSSTLTLTGLPAHTMIELSFDLYLFNTWDGTNPTFGQDSFSLTGGIVFSEKFTNHHGTSASPQQTYPTLGDVFLNQAGTALSAFGTSSSTQAFFGLGPTSSGSSFLAAHSGNTFAVTFGGPTSQTDEQWGIDNVRVTIDGRSTPVPEPTTLLLLGLGLAGLGFARKRPHQ